MTAPRTIAGRATRAAMRPHVKRALVRTIVSIGTEAIAPVAEEPSLTGPD